MLQRYEAKFVIPEWMVEPISDFASVYCSLDKYSEKTDDNFYRINNLYFDTPNYLFLMRRIDGGENRFNMRIRSYSDDSDVPCYFEIKQRLATTIKKYRAAVYDDHWQAVFKTASARLHKTKGAKAAENSELFLMLAHAYSATPKVLTQYRRKAFVSDIDDYARVTFDKELRYQPAEGYTLVPDEKKMTPLDHETLFDRGCQLVLEMKCYTTQVPLWMIDLIRCFDLRRRSFSKYVTGVVNVLNLYRYDPSIRQTALTFL